jgi:hypothetical protein
MLFQNNLHCLVDGYQVIYSGGEVGDVEVARLAGGEATGGVYQADVAGDGVVAFDVQYAVDTGL